MGSLAPQWSAVLNDAQRAAWTLYGQNVVLTDSLGQPIKLSGINQFIRSNAPRLQVGLDVILDAPTVFNIGDTPIITEIHVWSEDGGSDPAFVCNGTILAPVETGDTVLLYFGRPANAGVAFFRGPYRALPPATVDPTDLGAFFVSSELANLPFVPTIGQAIFVRTQVTRADGRLSADGQARAIVTAATP